MTNFVRQFLHVMAECIETYTLLNTLLMKLHTFDAKK